MITKKKRVTLSPYQKLGVERTLKIFKKTKGVLLADEMGLGKTPQALKVLQAIVNEEKCKEKCEENGNH